MKKFSPFASSKSQSPPGSSEGLKSLEEPLLVEPGDAKPPPSKRMSTASSVENAIVGAAESVPNECISSTMKASGPIIAVLVRILVNLAPFAVIVYNQCAKIYKAAPKNAVQMAFGLALCFYGGIFCASIAAIEAFRQMGWQTVYGELVVVTGEVKKIFDASAKDDAVDDDNDGTPDVEQITPAELAQRKVLLAMRAVTEPARLHSALGSLWAAYLAVLATLRLQFAQTVAIALGIVDSIHPPIMRLCAPPLSALLAPLEIGHWVETLLDAGLKLIALLVAWTFQMIISAFYSAVRGGKLFASAGCALVIERGWQGYVEKIPGVPAPFDPETTKIDEVVGFLLAAGGFTAQIMCGFTLSFPFNLVFLPLEMVEWLLRWQITFAAPATYGATPHAG